MENADLFSFLKCGLLPKYLYGVDLWGMMTADFIKKMYANPETKASFFPNFALVDMTCFLASPESIIVPKFPLTIQVARAISTGNYESMGQLLNNYLELIREHPEYYLDMFALVADSTISCMVSEPRKLTILH